MPFLDRVRKVASLTYREFLFWKWDRKSEAADRRMVRCRHERTMFVDVGSPPFDSIEKCRDCWALRIPKLDGSGRLEWVANAARPSRARPAARER